MVKKNEYYAILECFHWSVSIYESHVIVWYISLRSLAVIRTRNLQKKWGHILKSHFTHAAKFITLWETSRSAISAKSTTSNCELPSAHPAAQIQRQTFVSFVPCWFLAAAFDAWFWLWEDVHVLPFFVTVYVNYLLCSTTWQILLTVLNIFSHFVLCFVFNSVSLPLSSSENNYNSVLWHARTQKVMPSLAGRLKGFCRIGEKTSGDSSPPAFWESGHWGNNVTWWLNRQELATSQKPHSLSLCRTWRTKKKVSIASQPLLYFRLYSAVQSVSQFIHWGWKQMLNKQMGGT